MNKYKTFPAIQADCKFWSNFTFQEFAQAAEGGESTGSFDGDQTGYQTKFTFGDHGVAQLTPPSTPQETTFN